MRLKSTIRLIITTTLLVTSAAAGAQSAEADPKAPAWVTGTVTLAPECVDPSSTLDAGILRQRDYRCEPQTWASSDPRLGGAATSTWNADVYRADGTTVSVKAGAYEVRDDAGGWHCLYDDGLAHGEGLFTDAANDQTLTCAGSGANEGLMAILILAWSTTEPVTLEGFIFPGVPPAPESTMVE